MAQITMAEYRRKQMEIHGMISHYYQDSCDKQMQIAINEKEIHRLELELKALHNDFSSQFDKAGEAA